MVTSGSWAQIGAVAERRAARPFGDRDGFPH